MSFRVYGMTEHEARRLAQRSTPPTLADSLADWEAKVAEKAEKIMESKRNVPLSAVYDAPQFCREFIDLALRSGRCRGLHIRRPVKVEVTRRGKPVEKVVWQEC